MPRTHSAPVFIKLTDSDIDEIRLHAETQHFSVDQLVFSEGDEADSFYIVDHGEVVVWYDDKGAPKEISRLSNKDYFGEMAIYNNDRRSASVKSIAETDLLKINTNDFLRYIDQHPNLSEKISKNMEIRNEELILRENLIDITGLNSQHLHVGIKGDPSLRESAFFRERYESVVDKVIDQLIPNLEDIIFNRCIYRILVNFNSGEIQTSSIFNPFSEEVHTSDKLIDNAYVDRHFPKISYDEKSRFIKSLYQFISTDEHFNQLPEHWKNISSRSYENWQPLSKEEISKVMSKLGRLRNIQNFYLRNITISIIYDAIRMQFNCDGTHIISSDSYEKFLQDNLRATE